MRKSSVIVLTVFAMTAMLTAQADYVAEGYSTIMTLNEFGVDGPIHYPVPADEVHAGYDLDKDGNLEFIVLADHSLPNGPAGGWSDGHSVYVYEWNPGSSAFECVWEWADTTMLTGGASFPTMAVADLNGNGNLEIVLGIPSGADYPAPDVSPTVIFVFEFDAAGGPAEPTASWTAEAGPGANCRPAGMAAGDIDGDGVEEVAVGFRNYSSAGTDDALMIWSIDGDFAGDFTQFKIEVMDTTGDWGSVYAVDITDLDNDGNKEAYFSTDNHTVYEATGADTYEMHYVPSPAVYPWTVQASTECDLDGDGKNEMVFGRTDGHLSVYYDITGLDGAEGTYKEADIAMVAAASGCRGLMAGDFDNDGLTDVFMAGSFEGTLYRIEYKGSGDIADSSSYTYEKIFEDSTEAPRTYSVSFSGDMTALKQHGSSSTDMNGNGKPEVLLAMEASDTTTQNWIIMIESDAVLGIAVDPGARVLESFKLSQNYPNPFNPTTTINYSLSANHNVSLVVYDMLGREVRSLASGMKAAGEYSVNWDGTDNSGVQVASGMYVYTLNVDGKKLSNKMTFVK